MLVAYHHYSELEVPVYDFVLHNGNLLRAFSSERKERFEI